jgi:hypothetical protein
LITEKYVYNSSSLHGLGHRPNTSKYAHALQREEEKRSTQPLLLTHPPYSPLALAEHSYPAWQATTLIEAYF